MQVQFTGTSIDLYDYIWDFGNGVLDTMLNVNSSETTYAYQTIDTYTPKLILIDESNCARAIESPDSIQVTGINVDFLAIDSLLCGEDVTTSFVNLSQSTTPITSVEWILPGSLEGNTTNSEPTVTYPNSGVYDVSLFVTTEFCEDTLRIPNYIRVGSEPVSNFQASETIGCAPLSVDFSDMSSTANGGLAKWNWDFKDGGIAGQPNPTHVFNNAGIYQAELTVVTGFGCEATDSIAIEVLPTPAITLEAERVICQGELVTLSPIINGPVDDLTFTWSGGGPELSCTSCLSPEVMPMTTTTYQFTATNLEGCTATAWTTITVRASAIPDIGITPDTMVCASDGIQLNISGGDDIYSYQWDELTTGIPDLEWTNPVDLSCAYCADPVAFPDTTTVYQLEMVTNEGCLLQDSVVVTVLSESDISAGEDVFLCEGDSVTLNGSGGGAIKSPESLSNPNNSFTDAFPDMTTTYTVTGTLSNCPADTVLVTVNVAEGPEVNLNEITYALPDFPLVIEPVLDTTGNYQYSWFPAEGLSCTECLRPIVDSAFVGTTYNLLVTDMDTGCEKEVQTTTAALVSCPDELLWVPSAFSPNEDGRNDQLIVNSGTLNEIKSFQIFDRWGALVFQTDDLRLGWDGRMKGEQMPIGVYIYFVEATCPVNNVPILMIYALVEEVNRERIVKMLNELNPVNDELKILKSHWLSEAEMRKMIKEEFKLLLERKDGFRFDVLKYAIGGL